MNLADRSMENKFWEKFEIPNIDIETTMPHQQQEYHNKLFIFIYVFLQSGIGRVKGNYNICGMVQESEGPRMVRPGS